MQRDGRLTFSDPQVQARLKDVLLLRADVTANSADDQALLRRFALFGPPGIVFFHKLGQELAYRVIGFEPPEQFLVFRWPGFCAALDVAQRMAKEGQMNRLWIKIVRVAATMARSVLAVAARARLRHQASAEQSSQGGRRRFLIAGSRAAASVTLLAGLPGLRTAAAGAQAVQAPRGGAVALAFDPTSQTLFKASADALYRSGDGGRHRTPIELPPALASRRITSIAVPPAATVPSTWPAPASASCVAPTVGATGQRATKARLAPMSQPWPRTPTGPKPFMFR
ncbi:hypothetical protein [Cupriavidus basilensis]